MGDEHAVAASRPADREFLLGLEGIGWEGDLLEMRGSVIDPDRPLEWSPDRAGWTAESDD